MALRAALSRRVAGGGIKGERGSEVFASDGGPARGDHRLRDAGGGARPDRLCPRGSATLLGSCE